MLGLVPFYIFYMHTLCSCVDQFLTYDPSLRGQLHLSSFLTHCKEGVTSVFFQCNLSPSAPHWSALSSVGTDARNSLQANVGRLGQGQIRPSRWGWNKWWVGFYFHCQWLLC